MNTVTHDQDVLLKGFFASEVKFDEDVSHVFTPHLLFQDANIR